MEVLSYIVGLTPVGQGWFLWIQWECSVVLVGQDMGLPWFPWLFAESVSRL